MKSLSRRLVIIAVSNVIVSGTLPAYAHNHSHGVEHRAEWMAAKVSDELDLDEIQISKLSTLKNKLIAARQKMHS